MSTMIITRHAVDRYQERVAPSVRWDAALAALRQLAADAAPVDVTRDGHAVWHAREVYLVVRTVRLTLICVTVLDAAAYAERKDALARGSRAGAAWRKLERRVRRYDAEEGRASPREAPTVRRAIPRESVLRRCRCGRQVPRFAHDLVAAHAGPAGLCEGSGGRWSDLPLWEASRCEAG